MGTGERRSWRRGRPEGRVLEDVPVLSSASARTRRTLAPHVERLTLPPGAPVSEAGRPVHWVAIAVDGDLGTEGPSSRRWAAGRPVFLAEALLHGVAPATVVAHGEADVVLVRLPALTAAAAGDAALGVAIAKALAEDASRRPAATTADVPASRRRGFERRRLGRVAVRPAA